MMNLKTAIHRKSFYYTCTSCNNHDVCAGCTLIKMELEFKSQQVRIKQENDNHNHANMNQQNNNQHNTSRD